MKNAVQDYVEAGYPQNTLEMLAYLESSPGSIPKKWEAILDHAYNSSRSYFLNIQHHILNFCKIVSH